MMLEPYEILRASNSGLFPDLLTALYSKKISGKGISIHEYTGIVPYIFNANGEPLIDLSIYGNTVQNGTPTPDSPIMPEGTGERTAQLIDYPYFTADGLLSGVTWVTTIHSIKASGITTGGTNFYLFRNKLIKAGTYRMTINGTHKGMSLLLRDTTTATMIANLNPSTDTYQFTLESDMLTCSLYFNQSSANVSVDIDCTIMLNTGNTPLPYEPFGVKIPISSASTTTPVYLGEVESTRKVQKLVLDGTENWTISSAWKKTNTSVFYFPVSGIGGTSENERYILSTHFASKSRTELYRDDVEGIGKTGGNSVTVRVDDTIATTVNDFKAWLRDNNVTIWYVLATPQTAVVNEPLQKIGEYSDSLTATQAGVTIPTNNGSTTIDVETAVKPSNVYIKWKGKG